MVGEHEEKELDNSAESGIIKLKIHMFDEFIKDIKSKGYKGGDIRLCSCSTGQGEDSFAQQLSKKLGIKVKAPDSDLYYIPDDGVLYVGFEFRDIGKWRIFDKGVEVID